jgi:hypothetical protein
MNILLVRSAALCGLMAILHMAHPVDVIHGQESSHRQPSNLSIDSIFQSKDFLGEIFIGQWESNSQGFERIKRDPETGNASIVRIDLSNPAVEQVLVSSEMLTPAGIRKATYAWTPTNGRRIKTKLLIFANTERVWRLQHAR